MEDLSLSHEVVEAQLSAAPKSPAFKACPCCRRAFSKARWETLRFVGVQPDPEEPLELRDCDRCGSTMAVVVPAEVTVVDLSSRFPRGWGGVR